MHVVVCGAVRICLSRLLQGVGLTQGPSRGSGILSEFAVRTEALLPPLLPPVTKQEEEGRPGPLWHRAPLMGDWSRRPHGLARLPQSHTAVPDTP